MVLVLPVPVCPPDLAGFGYSFPVPGFPVRFGRSMDSHRVLVPNGVGCWKTRVRVRCYVRCWKPNDLTCVRMMLTCSGSNVFEAQDVSVMFDRKMLCYVRCSKDRLAGFILGWMFGVRCSDVRCSVLCSE